MRTSPNYSGTFLSLIKPLGTATKKNKRFSFFILVWQTPLNLKRSFAFIV